MAKRRKGLTIGKTRGFLYVLAKLLGDLNAVRRGTIAKRIMRRAVGRAAGRGIGKLFR